MPRFLRLSVAAIAFCVSAAAQTATGTIQGRVVDGTGSAVPEATVNIENQNTGVRQATITNSAGSFVQPYLIPGEYRLTVEKTGFGYLLDSGYGSGCGFVGRRPWTAADALVRPPAGRPGGRPRARAPAPRSLR